MDGEPTRPQPPEECLLVESEVLIRPYARTGGRTRPAPALMPCIGTAVAIPSAARGCNRLSPAERCGGSAWTRTRSPTRAPAARLGWRTALTGPARAT